MWVVPVLIVAAVLAGAQARAFERLEGHFVAEHACELFQSKRSGTNPGALSTEQGRAYEVIGLNVPERDYYHIRVEEAPGSQDRWVAADCGYHAAPPAAGLGEVHPVRMSVAQKARADHVLALSWQSAFCEIRPEARECALLNDGDLPMAEIRLSVHGLWPQPRNLDYCGVPEAIERIDRQGRWSELPNVALSGKTLEALDSAMPGARSFLHRHEWIRHGTCYGAVGGAEEYFADTLLVAEAVNGSAVVRFLARMLGEEIRTATVRERFDEAFGSGAGARVAFRCAQDGARTLLQEVHVSLRGEIGLDMALSDLIHAADPVPQGCERGIVDPFGLQ
jgi:ribonuclease T2